jgi:hypothetical protein
MERILAALPHQSNENVRGRGLLVFFAVGLRFLGVDLVLPVLLFHEGFLVLLRALVLMLIVRLGVRLREARHGQAEEDSEQQETDASRFHGLTGERCLAE